MQRFLTLEVGLDASVACADLLVGVHMRHLVHLKANVAPYVKVKAAGGMKTKADLFAFLEAGADRLGTSSGIKLLNE